MHTRKSKPWMSMRCFDGDQIRQRTMTLCPKEQPRRLFSCSRRNCEDGVHQEKQGHSIVECSKESLMYSFASACFNAIGGYNPGCFLRMWKETLKYTSGAKIDLLVPSQEHTAFERKGEGQDGSTACEARIFQHASIELFNHASLVNVLLTSLVLPPFHITAPPPTTWNVWWSVQPKKKHLLTACWLPSCIWIGQRQWQSAALGQSLPLKVRFVIPQCSGWPLRRVK